MLMLVRINMINTIYVKNTIISVGIIENNKSLIIIEQLNNTVHQHSCTLQVHVSDTHSDHITFFFCV